MATQLPSIYGTAWSCISDLTMPSIMVTGFRVVAEAIARRWQTPRGGYVGDPNYGYDLSNFVNDDMDVRELSNVAKMLGAEAEKDERVQSCDVTLRYDPDGTLTATAKVSTAAGPFQLVVSVEGVTLNLLQVSAI